MGVGEAGQRVRRKPETDEVALIGTRVDRLGADRWVGEADNPTTHRQRVLVWVGARWGWWVGRKGTSLLRISLESDRRA
jgi:hypothetical protein